MIEVKGKQATAKVVLHSVADGRPPLFTLQLTYPRIIHSEFMTHRMFSRNAMSSRAVPVAKMLEQVRTNPAMPVRFGGNRPGMQDTGDHFTPVKVFHVEEDDEPGYMHLTPQDAWRELARQAAHAA